MNRFAPLDTVKSRPILGVVVAILVPLLTAGILIGVLHKPQERLNEITAAIVNNDAPVELDGQLVPLGRQLASGLVASGESDGEQPAGYQWEITDAQKASDGLESGKFGAVVTIPENFSAAATSTAGDISGVEQATISVTKSPHARLMDDAITTALASAATNMMGTELTQTFLDNIFVGFNTLHSELGEAAGGAGELAAGTVTLAGGVSDLQEGVGQLGGGAEQLAAGSQELAGGLGEFHDGIRQLSAGSSDLADGAGDLAGGAAGLADGLGELHSGLGDLATGGAELAGGLDELAAGTADLPGEIAPLQEGINGLEGGANQLVAGIEAQAEGLAQLAESVCAMDANGQLCLNLQALAAASPELAGGAAALADGAREIGAGVGQMTAPDGEFAQLSGGLAALTEGANALVDGLSAVHDASGDAANGAKDLAGGASELAGGAGDLRDGIGALEGGSSELGEGAAALSSGAVELADGIDELESGVGELASGSAELRDGAGELADGLGEAVDQIPTYPDEYRANAAQIIADPVAVAGGSDAAFDLNLTRNWIGFFTVIALWISALWIYTSVPTTISNFTATTRSSAWVSLRSLALPALVAIGQGLTVTILVAIFGDVSGGRLIGFGVLASLIAVTFLLVQRALLAVAGRIGLVVSLGIAILAIATALTSAMPSTVRALVGWLPIGAATEALNGLENSLPIGGAIVGVVVWAVAGWAVIALDIRKRRVALPATT